MTSNEGRISLTRLYFNSKQTLRRVYPLLATSTPKPTFPYFSPVRYLNRNSSGQARRPHIVSISFPPQPKFGTLMYALLLVRVAHGDPFGCARTFPSHPVEMPLYSCPILKFGVKESTTIQYTFRLHAKPKWCKNCSATCISIGPDTNLNSIAV